MWADFEIFPGQTGIGSPSWSPEGERIVFEIDGEESLNRIYVVDADGGGLKRLTDFEAFCPAWSPDGSRIAFSKGSGLGIGTRHS